MRIQQKDVDLSDPGYPPEMVEKMNKKRANVAREIVSTEESYLGKISMLIEVVVDPLKKMVGTEKSILSDDEIRTIFSDLKIIIGYKSLILPRLNERISQWTNQSVVGDILLEMVMFSCS